jgi:hypothetical protein
MNSTDASKNSRVTSVVIQNWLLLGRSGVLIYLDLSCHFEITRSFQNRFGRFFFLVLNVHIFFLSLGRRVSHWTSCMDLLLLLGNSLDIDLDAPVLDFFYFMMTRYCALQSVKPCILASNFWTVPHSDCNCCSVWPTSRTISVWGRDGSKLSGECMTFIIKWCMLRLWNTVFCSSNSWLTHLRISCNVLDIPRVICFVCHWLICKLLNIDVFVSHLRVLSHTFWFFVLGPLIFLSCHGYLVKLFWSSDRISPIAFLLSWFEVDRMLGSVNWVSRLNSSFLFRRFNLNDLFFDIFNCIFVLVPQFWCFFRFFCHLHRFVNEIWLISWLYFWFFNIAIDTGSLNRYFTYLCLWGRRVFGRADGSSVDGRG